MEPKILLRKTLKKHRCDGMIDAGSLFENSIIEAMEEYAKAKAGQHETIVMWRCVEDELPDTDKMVLTCTITGDVSVGRYRQINSTPRDYKLQEWKTQLKRSTNEVYWWAEYTVPKEAT